VVVKRSDGWYGAPGFFGVVGPELGPFRRRKEATAALVEKAMAGADGSERKAA
jgi:hypothetical protein